jgi:uncharacterized protein (DUF433 family)/lipid-A-disaccharide synthase-like uncharacterized protein
MQPPCSEHQYLVYRPEKKRKQPYLKGRNMTVSQLVYTMRANQMSAEQAAEDMDLPLEQVLEAMTYYETHRSLIKNEVEEEKQRHTRGRKLLYWLTGLSFILTVIADVVMKRHSTLDRLAWEIIAYEFWATATCVLLGLSMVLDYRHLVSWLEEHLHWKSRPRMFRAFGFLVLLGSLPLLAIFVMDLLAALGVIPNPYLP